MRGFIDLHCHFLPGIDDGAQTVEESIRLCRGLFRLGFDTVVATPHIRSAMFENTKADLIATYNSFIKTIEDVPEIPKISLAAEYYFNDVFWHLFEKDEVLLYSRSTAMLVEFPIEQVPLNVEHRLFKMSVRGIQPVLAHPERYIPLLKSTQPIHRMLETGLLALLDIKALVGKQGNRTKRAAERMLEEGVFFAASTDAHHPEDIVLIERGIERLKNIVGEDEMYELLISNPQQLLQEAKGQRA